MATKKELELQKRIQELENQPFRLLKVPYNMDDPSPLSREERASYVARVAGFYKDIFETKVTHMISDLQKELSNPLSSREMDIYVKATINALSLLMDWGDEMVNEQLENISNNKEE